MPDMTNPLQPFMNLMQANLALLSKYATSPDAMTQAMSQVQAAMTTGPDTAVAKTPVALTELAQGMMQNFTRFMTELMQTGMATFAQGHEVMTQQLQEVTGSASEGGRSRRSSRS